MPGIGISTPKAPSQITSPAPPQPTGPSPQDLIKDLLDEEQFKQRRQEEKDRIKESRQTNIQEGQEFIKDFSLGRIGDDPTRTADNLKLKQLLEGRLGGLSSGEGAAMREQAFGGLNRQRQEGIRALRGLQGSQGVRGPAAVAQQQDVFNRAADRGSDLEQQLLLRNIDIQRQASADFGNELQRQQSQGLGIEQFNIGQGDRETGIKTAFPLQFANLGLQEDAAATGAITGRDALIAALFPDLLSQLGGAGAGGIGGGPPISQADASQTSEFLNTIGETVPGNVATAAAGPTVATMSPQEARQVKLQMESLGQPVPRHILEAAAR